MNLSFVVVDVFTAQAFAGNPLAIVYDDAEASLSLTTEQMQALAREMNLSETVFVTDWDRDQGRFAVRIFTPFKELPFAGHPTIGTAAWLAGRCTGADGRPPEAIVLDEVAGPVRCQARWSGRTGVATLAPPQVPFRVEAAELTPDDIVAELGVDEAEIVGEIEVWSAGMAVHCVELDAPERLDALRVPALNGPLGHVELSCFAFGPGDDVITARVFPLAAGIAEDPATGAAAVALAGRIAPRVLRDRSEAEVTIHQGAHMGRPSRLRLHLRGAAGRLDSVELSGEVVAISQGRWLQLPQGVA